MHQKSPGKIAGFIGFAWQRDPPVLGLLQKLIAKLGIDHSHTGATRGECPRLLRCDLVTADDDSQAVTYIKHYRIIIWHSFSPLLRRVWQAPVPGRAGIRGRRGSRNRRRSLPAFAHHAIKLAEDVPWPPIH